MWMRFSHLIDVIVRLVTYMLFPVYTGIDVYKTFFFSNRVVEPWNSLPAESHHLLSLYAFKTFLKSVDLSKFAEQ